jgi:hypothetical protein
LANNINWLLLVFGWHKLEGRTALRQREKDVGFIAVNGSAENGWERKLFHLVCSIADVIASFINVQSTDNTTREKEIKILRHSWLRLSRVFMYVYYDGWVENNFPRILLIVGEALK